MKATVNASDTAQGKRHFSSVLANVNDSGTALNVHVMLARTHKWKSSSPKKKKREERLFCTYSDLYRRQ